ncbi:dienelactone hydrolase family protein [Vibrio sp. SCSIO 43136]|uniref:alpha/beta hydrolase family protein n=1 Tax=Vibrio sp. SCSIO 43136 TaxID=2819101 RepID=UPI002075EAE6|nr:dienelactone hydrolase family protein [Vibrio sp. SCSIO 43136]USD64051.1 dienelactone hydrolase family protein [Vibrio sp. SCSIO 43136]
MKILPPLLVSVCVASTSAIANNYGDIVKIPLQEDDGQILLEARVFKPTGDGPFPTVIFSHGSTGPNAIPLDYTVNPWVFGDYLNQRNIALIAPMRRGRGNSQGQYEEGYTCSPEGIEKGINYADKSLDATYQYLVGQPWVDKSNLVLSGNSRGGILSLVHAARQPEKFVGVINFSGGWVGDVCKYQNVSPNESILSMIAKSLKTPTLFIYGRNDPYYADQTIQNMVKAYTDAGGNVDFKFYSFGQGVSGHNVFYEQLSRWSNAVERYLEQVMENKLEGRK